MLAGSLARSLAHSLVKPAHSGNQGQLGATGWPQVHRDGLHEGAPVQVARERRLVYLLAVLSICAGTQIEGARSRLEVE